jgi:predicted methyltransferase
MNYRALYLTMLLLAFALSGCQSCQAQQPQVTADGYAYKKPAAGGTGKVYMGREIAAIMTSTGGNWLDRDSRQEEENSAQILQHMQLKPTDVVADIGAGTGFYTFQIAPQVPQGKVYAVEVQDRFVEQLRKRKEKVGAAHVEVVKGSSQRINLPDQSLDVALMVDVYHELEFPREVLQTIHQALKPGGRLILLEYKAEDPNVNIRALHKMSAAQIKKELEANGFSLERQETTLPLQHLLVFVKSPR